MDEQNLAQVQKILTELTDITDRLRHELNQLGSRLALLEERLSAIEKRHAYEDTCDIEASEY